MRGVCFVACIVLSLTLEGFAGRAAASCTGTPAFGSPARFRIAADDVDAGGFSTAAGDFNGDQRLDLAVGAWAGTGAVSILLGDGHGGFQPPRLVLTGSEPALAIAAADFNRDGHVDLVLAVVDSLVVLLGDGTGAFAPPRATRVAVDHNVTSLAVADFNGDQRPDVIVTMVDADAKRVSIALLLGNSAGGFAAPTTVSLGDLTWALSVVALDFNGDGRMDAAVAVGPWDPAT